MRKSRQKKNTFGWKSLLHFLKRKLSRDFELASLIKQKNEKRVKERKNNKWIFLLKEKTFTNFPFSVCVFNFFKMYVGACFVHSDGIEWENLIIQARKD